MLSRNVDPECLVRDSRVQCTQVVDLLNGQFNHTKSDDRKKGLSERERLIGHFNGLKFKRSTEEIADETSDLEKIIRIKEIGKEKSLFCQAGRFKVESEGSLLQTTSSRKGIRQKAFRAKGI